MNEGIVLNASDLNLSDNAGALGNDTAHSVYQGPDGQAHGAGDLDTQEETLEMVEEKAIRNAMARYGGNLSLVAKSLDISRPTLYSKLKKYGI